MVLYLMNGSRECQIEVGTNLLKFIEFKPFYLAKTIYEKVIKNLNSNGNFTNYEKVRSEIQYIHPFQMNINIPQACYYYLNKLYMIHTKHKRIKNEKGESMYRGYHSLMISGYLKSIFGKIKSDTKFNDDIEYNSSNFEEYVIAYKYANRLVRFVLTKKPDYDRKCMFNLLNYMMLEKNQFNYEHNNYSFLEDKSIGINIHKLKNAVGNDILYGNKIISTNIYDRLRKDDTIICNEKTLINMRIYSSLNMIDTRFLKGKRSYKFEKLHSSRHIKFGDLKEILKIKEIRAAIGDDKKITIAENLLIAIRSEAAEMIKNNTMIKICKSCDRYFIPGEGREIYCNNESCEDAAIKTYKKRNDNEFGNALFLLRNRITKRKSINKSEENDCDDIQKLLVNLRYKLKKLNVEDAETIKKEFVSYF
jgi:hypothetical protein